MQEKIWRIEVKLSESKDILSEGLTFPNVSIIKFYDFYLLHYIH